MQQFGDLPRSGTAPSIADARELRRGERVLILGAGPVAQAAGRRLSAFARGVSIVGAVGDESETQPAQRYPLLGEAAELEQICRSRRIDRLLVACSELGENAAEAVGRLSGGELEVSVLPWVLSGAEDGPDSDTWDRGVMPRSRFRRTVKRLIEIVVSGAALLVLLPFLILLGLAIRLDSPGPALFAHERVGRGGRRIRIYKLRTMVADAEERVAELRAQSAHPVWLLLDSDPRITRLGGLLRRTSIDELPQLWNVLKGEMSLVGPRPLSPHEDAHVTGWGRARLELPPGITGLWQVLGRVDIPFEEMLRLDYLYVTTWTLRGDLEILVRTVGAVLSRRGAN